MKQTKASDQEFDYDVGYLVKSPCRDCGTYGMFPDCVERCAILDRIQTALSTRMSSLHSHSDLEAFELRTEFLERA
jgi:hypothetical protein